MKKGKIFKSLLLVLLLASTFIISANAVEPRKDLGYRWNDASATVYFYCGFNDTWKNAISAGMISWNNVLNNDNEIIVPMAFTGNSSHSNRIYSTSGQTWLGKMFPTSSSGILTAASIAFNSGDYTFTVGAVSGRYDIQTVATHELGHAIGVAHCHERTETSCFSDTCSTNVMQPTVPSNYTRRNLTSYDTSSKKIIYW